MFLPISFLYTVFKFGIDKSEGSTIPARPKPYVLFLTGAVSKGLFLLKLVFHIYTCNYVFFHISVETTFFRISKNLMG